MLDTFTRVHESLHCALPDLTAAEPIQEPHPPIGWRAWRISRLMDTNVSPLSGRERLWIVEGWYARFNMPPSPADFLPLRRPHTRASTGLSRLGSGADRYLDRWYQLYATSHDDLDKNGGIRRGEQRRAVLAKMVTLIRTGNDHASDENLHDPREK